MRFPILLVTGLVCIVLGVAGSEWSRRHPAEKLAPVVLPPPAALTADALAVTEPLADVPADAEQLHVSNAELTGFARDVKLPESFAVAEAKAVLGGSLFARHATAHGNAVFFISEEGKQGAKQTLVRVTAGDLPRALAVHRPGVGALALDGTRLYWSEGGAIFSTDSTAGGAAKAVVQFPKARITSLGVSGNLLVAALVPKALDPFSSEPVGAIVSVSISDGRVKVLAGKQVRPAEVRTDGRSAVWIAGYPAELWQAELPGGEPRLLSTRADGPVLLENAFITFRHPVVGSPELVRMGADGTSVVLAKGEVDRVTQLAGDSWFSVGGTVSRVDARGEQTQVVARLPQPVLELAVTDDALYVVTRQEAGGHLLVRLPRSTPEGARP
ncbi:MAG: hypothetical protein H6Q89_1155 [Myxococcaceae bacterium]|nr:hypothetical protein [Myxococcaceae bacterium]